MLETDSPDMPLAEFTDRPNEPARVADVLILLNELRHESKPQLVEQLLRNTKQALKLS